MNNKLKISAETPTINVLMSGVGGQGVLVASDVLVLAAMHADFDAKKSEIHGMAQRGGSVVSQIRFGEKIYSPLINKGTADIILAFEKLEAIRYLDFLKPGGAIIYNDQQITPLSVFFSNIAYPGDVETICIKRTDNIVRVKGLKISDELKNPRVLNSVMLGALSNFLQFDNEHWIRAIEHRVPPKTLDLNRKAFEAGQAR